MIIITNDVDKLVNENHKLAYKVAWSYFPKIANYIEFDDALSICYEGLMKAAKLYDETKGYAFSTYAYPSIKNTLICYVRRLSNKNSKLNTLSLDASLVSDDEYTLTDTLASDYDLEEQISKNDTNRLLYKFISELPEDLKQIMQLKLNGANQEQIAKILNTTQPNVSRKYIKALNFLRNKFEKGGML